MKRYRFAYLFASLLIVLFLRPFIAEQVLGLALSDILLLVTLTVGAYTAIENKRQFWIVAILILMSTGWRIAWVVTRENSILIGFLITAIISYGYLSWLLLQSLFTSDQNAKITRDTLYKAVSIYLMFGITWVFAYSLLELTAPGSFVFGTQSLDGNQFERFIGFSFTTLTTLGYGNISPATPRADALTTLQAITGQIYLAIVIARLVAMQLMQGKSES